jgi:UDP-N-acetylglucosamine--N-acetylmuramyl-(pentapeptide) pyrophosphoryl-undecaprenol N-acetylglucosamine transferase
MHKTIIVAVGGTGGHVIPAQKIGAGLSSDFYVIYMGVGLSKNPFFQKEKSPFYDVEGASLSKGLVSFFIKNIRGVFQARKLLKKHKASHVIGFGSFHSFPILLAALFAKVPFDLFEFNIIPGKVNALFSRWARKIFIHFEPKGGRFSKNLVKIDFSFEEVKTFSKEEAREFFGLEAKKKTLLVFGGSQGAEAINEIMPDVVKELKEEFQIIHFPGKESRLEEIYKNLGAKFLVSSFCNRMELAWNAADLAICRAGAGAMREMLIFEKPAILIPYPNATDDHQTENAKYMEDVVKGGVFLSQENLTAQKLIEKIFHCVKNSDQMKESIRFFKKNERRSFFNHKEHI